MRIRRFKVVSISGKNADNFIRAVELSKKNKFNYKEIQNLNRDKLKQLSNLLSRKED